MSVVLCVHATSQATTWTVDDDGPADFDNIQAAVDFASHGDEIIVYPGTYTSTNNEVVNTLGKQLWIHSIDGAETTIIDGQDTRRGISVTNVFEGQYGYITQWTVEAGGNGHWYQYVGVDQNWQLHQDEALARGGYLVSINSQDENDFLELLRDEADSEGSYVTCGYQEPKSSEPDGGWQWATGEPFDFTNWGYSDENWQPDNFPANANRIGNRWQENGIWCDVTVLSLEYIGN